LTLQTQEWMAWKRFICLRIGKSGRLFWHFNKPSGSIKGTDFLNSLKTTSFLRRTQLHTVRYYPSTSSLIFHVTAFIEVPSHTFWTHYTCSQPSDITWKYYMTHTTVLHKTWHTR
jgi:hypothetical protein